MAAKAGKSLSRLFVWVILALLFVALAGFGIGSFGGGASRLGEVGETEITAQDYARALDNEIRAQIAQTQTPVNLADLRARGIDEAVLASLVARAALANESAALGLSVGDAEVARQIRRSRGSRASTGPSTGRPTSSFFRNRVSAPASSRRTCARTPPARFCRPPSWAPSARRKSMPKASPPSRARPAICRS
jgi:hypothetical protein